MTTIHIYFAGGVKDGVIESITDPPQIIRIPVGKGVEHVYERTAVEFDWERIDPYRGRKGVWVFVGESYLPEFDLEEE